MSELSIGTFDVCDDRNEDLVQKISEYDVAILSGGHVPTQNEFFKKIRLRDGLSRFNRYILFLIFGRLFNKLYEFFLRKIETDIEYSFNYYNVIEFSVPDYVNVSRDDFFEVYEIE